MKKNFKVRFAICSLSKNYEKPDHIDINRVNDKVKYEPNESTHRFLGIIPIGINCFGSP